MIIIPARLGSTRFPNKPLAKILGKEMIVRVCEVCSGISETWVAVPDKQLMKFVNSKGFKAVMTGQHCTGTDRVAEAINYINDDPDNIYINVQGDAPTVSAFDLLSLFIEKKKYPNHVIGTMCRKTHNNENVVKVVQNAGQLIYMTREGDAKYRQCGLYAFNRQELELFASVSNKKEVQRKYENIELMRFIDIGYPVRMLEVEGGPEVDVPEDVEIVERFLKNRKLVKVKA